MTQRGYIPHSSAKRLILIHCATAMYVLVSSVDHMVFELRILPERLLCPFDGTCRSLVATEIVQDSDSAPLRSLHIPLKWSLTSKSNTLIKFHMQVLFEIQDR